GPVPGQAAARRGGGRTHGVHRPHQPARTGRPARRRDAHVRRRRRHHAGRLAVRRKPRRRRTHPARGRRGAGPFRSGGVAVLAIWKAIVLGIVEGLTEFLPVSSTGHLTIFEKLLNMDIEGPGPTAFTAIIQVGAIIAAIIYFAKDLWRVIRGFFAGL